MNKTMRKTYIQPTLEVVKIQTGQLLAGSVDKFNSTLDDNGVNADDALAPGLDLFGMDLPGTDLP